MGGRITMAKLRHFKLYWRDGRVTDAYSTHITNLLLVIEDSGQIDALDNWEEVSDESQSS